MTISSSPPATGRWMPRKSYQVGQKTTYPFDLRHIKKAPSKPVGFFSKIIQQLRPEKEFELPTIEDFQGIYKEDTSTNWSYGLSLPNPFERQLSWSELIHVREEETYFEIPDKEQLLKAIRMLFLMKGRLVRNKEGVFNLQLPKKLLNLILPQVLQWGAEIPPYFQLMGTLGPHIPIILPHEDLDGFSEFNELGEEFYFAVKDVICREVPNWNGIQKVWYITFESYHLEALRQKYGLTSHLSGQDFHCVIGLEGGVATEKPEYYTINPISEPAVKSWMELNMLVPLTCPTQSPTGTDQI